MRPIVFLFFLINFFLELIYAQPQNKELRVWDSQLEAKGVQDWLVKPISATAEIFKSSDGKDLIAYNGLVKRTFRLQPNVTCTDYENMMNGQQLIRAVKPQARLAINGKVYQVGGLYGQHENAYLLPEWLDQLTAGENDFAFVSYSITAIKPFIHWKPVGWNTGNAKPAGKLISFLYRAKSDLVQQVEVTVNYEIYDGLPLIIKWISVQNKSAHTITINRAVNEILGLVEEESAVVGSPEQMKKQHGVYVETNYAFNNAMRYDISDQTTHWKADSSYTSQVNYNFQTPCLLEVYPEKVTDIDLQPGDSFHSVRTSELLMDSYDRERRGLMIRKMYRTIAPWTTENPVFMHLVSKNDGEVKRAIDQCAQTGYEAVILSFGSHCNMEDTSKINIEKWTTLSRYAHERNIRIGGYSLFSSRRISEEDDVIDPVTGRPDAAAFFGSAPCLGSKWGLAYLEKLKYFLHNTGFDIFENDGPYPGDVCASVTHPGHKRLGDSQWRQMELQKGLYHWCNEQGIYVNAPDWYFLDGTNKIAIGYREVNFSLPREDQEILNRQNIYDGLWEKSPSMSWGFVPLTKYQGGGPEAVLEPLSEHLKDYEQLMMQYYGAGVQACYRGPELFDNDQTKQVVTRTVAWYKKYRHILNADIIHLRRPDGRDWDGIMHADAQSEIKGLIMLYNPLNEKITRTVTIPLYYTGLEKSVVVKEKEGKPKTRPLNNKQELQLSFTLAPGSYTWFSLK